MSLQHRTFEGNCLQHMFHTSIKYILTWKDVEAIMNICQEENYQYTPTAPQADRH
jgi:hypothetical protein